jgi:hypothetical protein
MFDSEKSIKHADDASTEAFLLVGVSVISLA